MRTTPGGSSGPGAPGVDRAAHPEAPSRPPFALVLAVTLTGILGNVLIVPALPDIVADLGVARARAGLLLAATTAPGILLAPVIGVLADRFGRREVLVPCLAVFGVAGGMAAFAPSFPVLVLLRLLQGTGSAGLINLAVVIITDHWHGVERARMIGRNAAVLTASLVVLPPVGGVLADVGGWRATFAPYWLALATAAAVVARLPAASRPSRTLRSQLAATGAVLRSWVVVGPMVLGSLMFTTIFGLLTVAPVYLADAFELSASGRGAVLGLPALTSTAAALSLGRLRAVVGAGVLVTTGLSVMAAGLATVAAVPALGGVAAGLLCFGVGEGLLIATLQDTVAGAAPAGARGTVVATWVAFVRAGQTGGPLLAGAGVDHLGARSTFAAGAALAGVLAAARPALLRPPGTGGRPEAEGPEPPAWGARA